MSKDLIHELETAIVTKTVTLPEFQEITKQGYDIIPELITALKRKSVATTAILLALEAIHGGDPVETKHIGNITEMAKAWIELEDE